LRSTRRRISACRGCRLTANSLRALGRHRSAPRADATPPLD
jgi:hypothetical protein